MLKLEERHLIHLISSSLILLVSDRDPRTNRFELVQDFQFFLGPGFPSGSTSFVPWIPGVRYIKSNLGSQFNHDVECKLRVLDSFGTDEIFNDRNSKIKNNGWGKLGLNLKQFWTFYPHNQECLINLK